MAKNSGEGGWLVTDDNGGKHLPTTTNGKPDHRLMGAAWAALHNGYRGKKYSGPNKEEAIKKLKAMYKREGMETPMSNGVLFVELTEANLKAFDGLAPGKFVDMRGRAVEFSPSDFPAYIENTQAVIESTKTEGGEIVGLPIDLDGHDHKGGAGWIVGLELDPARDVIRFLANWTDAGADLIRKNVRRFFSPSVDPYAQVVLGGSLTNWPASRDEKYRMALRPIELSDQIQALSVSDSLGSLVSQVASDFNEQFECPDMWAPLKEQDDYFHVFGWPNSAEVYDNYLIAQSMSGDMLFKVGYEIGPDGETVFDDPDAWRPVKIAYTEQPMSEQSMFLRKLNRTFENVLQRILPARKDDGAGSRQDGDHPTTEGENEMAGTTVPTVVELMKTPEAVAELDRLANERAEARIKQEENSRKVAEFSAKLTGGISGKGTGTAVTKERVAEVILSLPEDKQPVVMALLEDALKGVIDFREKGHGSEFENKREFPPQLRPILISWLKSGKTVAEFFTVNPEAGKFEEYNLQEFVELQTAITKQEATK